MGKAIWPDRSEGLLLSAEKDADGVARVGRVDPAKTGQSNRRTSPKVMQRRAGGDTSAPNLIAARFPTFQASRWVGSNPDQKKKIEKKSKRRNMSLSMCFNFH